MQLFVYSSTHLYLVCFDDLLVNIVVHKEVKGLLMSLHNKCSFNKTFYLVLHNLQSMQFAITMCVCLC